MARNRPTGRRPAGRAARPCGSRWPTLLEFLPDDGAPDKPGVRKALAGLIRLVSNTSAHPEPKITTDSRRAEPSQTSRNTPVCVAALSERKSIFGISKHCSVHGSELNTVLVGFVQIAILVREQKSSDFHISRHAPIIAPNRVPLMPLYFAMTAAVTIFSFRRSP